MPPFVVWFQQRSGSSHLVSILNRHPQINCRGEMFACEKLAPAPAPAHPDNVREFNGKPYRRFINLAPGQIENPSDLESVNALDEWFQSGEKLHGFKFKFPSQSSLFPMVDARLKERAHEVFVIVLKRQNRLRRAISLLNMQRLQVLTSQSNVRERVELPPLVVDLDEVIRLIRYYESIDGAFFQWAGNFDRKIEVEYANLLKQPDQTLSKISNFLGLDRPLRFRASLAKVTPTDLEQAISNYDALTERLNAENLSIYLD